MWISAKSSPKMCSDKYQELDPTHRGCHKFIPRHSDEIFVEIGDPLHVIEEADDLWCEGNKTSYFIVFNLL